MPITPHNAPDIASIITNIGVFIAAVSATWVAVRSASKKIKDSGGPPAHGDTSARLIAGAIMDNTSILMWSESNREVAEALRDLRDEMKELRFATMQLRDTMR